MNAKQIQSLVLLLAPDGPYFELMGRQMSQRPHSLARRLQFALMDPGLLAHISESYALSRLPLPEFPWPAAVHRAYRFFLDPKTEDKNLASAQRLQRPESQFEGNVIRGLLLCPEATDEMIAKVFEVEPEAINLFELLWWRVRGRELLYLCQVLNGRYSLAEPGIDNESEELAVRLRRVGHKSVDPRAVLIEADLVGWSEEPVPESKLFEQVIRNFLESLLGGCQKGQLSKRELSLVEKYLPTLHDCLQTDSTSEDIFLAISRNKECQAKIKEFLEEQRTSKLKAERLQLAIAQGSKEASDYQI